MTVIRGEDIELTGYDQDRVGGKFGIRDLVRIGGFENALYRSPQLGRVVRITHTSRRSPELVEAEFAFMCHLASNRVPVVAPIPSEEGNLVEEIQLSSGERVVVACMAEAEGRTRPADEWTPDEIETYGVLLGAMHSAAARFEPGVSRRPPWSNPMFDVGLSAAAETDPELFERSVEIRAAAAAHPAGRDDLLIHQDAHLWNLFITDSGEITIFDFDDSAYGTPAHDVAIVLFYWLIGLDQDLPQEAGRFLTPFVKGYERHSRLPVDWPEGADRFLSYREIDVYWLLTSENPDDTSPAELRFMKGRRQRILDGVPYIGMPLAEIL